MRVTILKNFAKENFPATPLLDYAIEVEKITTSKVFLVFFPGFFWLCFLLLLRFYVLLVVMAEFGAIIFTV